MVVAVAVMRMMQMAIDQVVDMISMGYGRMPAPRPMHVLCTMSPANVPAST